MLMKRLLFLYFIGNLYTAFPHQPVEFIYPVDTIEREGGQEFCSIYQKGTSLELWFWNPETKVSTKGLLSSFTPAGLKVLPNKQGFSFIDNDRIRVKMLNKRSPKTLDFYGPYDLSVLEWVDSSSILFSAKERKHFNLFQGTKRGDLSRLTASTSDHFLYPQKVNNTLFFVRENEEGTPSICSAPYPLIKDNQTVTESDFKAFLENVYGESFSPLLPIESIQSLKSFEKEKALAFLTMKDTSSGFFIEHPKTVKRSDESVQFEYHTFTKDSDQQWDSKKLFNFTVPLSLIMEKPNTETRLYESILPLLPFHDGKEKIYFSDLDKSGALNVFCYSLSSGDSTQKTFGENPEEIYFPPRRYKDRLYCGGMAKPSEEEGLPHIYIDYDDTQHFTFLEI